jgi:hypothetical protein
MEHTLIPYKIDYDVCIEKGSTLHQVFNEGRLLGTFEGNPHGHWPFGLVDN